MSSAFAKLAHNNEIPLAVFQTYVLLLRNSVSTYIFVNCQHIYLIRSIYSYTTAIRVGI